jgi:GNAT superfamily N-acetyltransferase
MLEGMGVELDRYRMVLGAGAAELLALPGSTITVTDRFWMAASGLAAPSLNQALVHVDDPDVLEAVVEDLGARPHPAHVMLAGDGRNLASQMPEAWRPVGELAIMAVEPDRTPSGFDDRVRPAGIEDATAITDLFEDAFAGDRETFSTFLIEGFARSTRTQWWLLEESGVPVSTVLTVSHEDTVSLWCMATPPQLSRRGYARALLGHVLARAAQDGVSLGLLGATPAGYRLYASTGWTEVERWQMYEQG